MQRRYSRLFRAWLDAPPDRPDGVALTDATLPVLVVGAGPAGLAAMSALQRGGVAFEAVESHGAVGGIWDRTNPVSSVYEGMRTAASRSTSYLLRPMPTSWPHFVPFELVQEYLHGFAEEEGILGSIAFGTRFEGATKSPDGTWTASLQTREDGGSDERQYRAIVIATGSHNRDHAMLDADLLAAARAAGIHAIHSAEYDNPSPFVGKRVLIVGAGASATDIAGKLSRVTERTILAVRHDPWIIPASVLRWVPLMARLGIVPDRLAADTRWIPNRMRNALFSAVIRFAARDLRRHGLARPHHGLFDRVPVLDRGVLQAIRSGAVEIRPGIVGFEDRMAIFDDRSREPFDDVIFATGYARHYPLLPESHEPTAVSLPAFGLFHPTEPGLAFMAEMVGAGSCWPIFIAQGRAIAAYFAVEQSRPDRAAAFNARRSVPAPSFKGALFADADAFHIDYGHYERALTDLVAWLESGAANTASAGATHRPSEETPWTFS